MSAVAFCFGFLVTATLFEPRIVPELVKKYPNDGQIGIEAFVASCMGGSFFAITVLVAGAIWTVKTSRRSLDADAMVQRQ